MKLQTGEKLGVQFRTQQIDLSKARTDEQDKRWVRGVSFSSEEPYERSFGMEVLSHKAGAIRDQRAEGSAMPLLFNHNRDMHLGKPHNFRVENGRTVCDLYFSENPMPQEKLRDLRDGILTETSIAYQVHKYEADSSKDTYTATDWELLECSLVTIPADYTVGATRNFENEGVTVEISEKKGLDVLRVKQNTEPMPDPTTPSGSAVTVKSESDIRAEITREFEAEQARKEQVTALSTRFNRWVDNETRDTFLRTAGRPVAELQAIILEKQAKQPVEQVAPVSEGMKEKDLSKYSMVRAINGILNGNFDGLEREMSAHVAKLHNRQGNSMGFFVPQDVMTRTLFATGAPTAAGLFVDAGPQGQSLIDLYRNKMNVVAMGAQVLSGLTGDLAIPRQTGGATASWLAEDATVSATNQAVGQLLMKPHRLAAATGYSRQLLTQSSIDVENFVRNDLMTVLAIEKDRAALLGSGSSGEPLGVYNTPGIGSTVDITATSSITYAEAVQFETNIAAGNADIGSLGYITSIYIRGTARITAKFASTATPLWDGDMLANHKARATNQLTATPSVIFGNWADMIIGDWASPEVIVDPYSLSLANQVRVVVNQLTDIGIRHPASFCFGVV
jgi:HK97 family phage major capsid protein/HK97 family phage prohead protease